MKYREFRHMVAADLYRYDGAKGMTHFFRAFLQEPGFRFTCLLRSCRLLRSQAWSRWGAYHFFKLWLKGLSIKLSVYIDITTEIGPGLYIPHPCGIIVNRRCHIGANCNIAQHVTLGLKSREPRMGCPKIGNRVYIGPGAVVIGAIEVGDDAAIGANCVVVKEVPAHSVVAGIPGKFISSRGSEGYVNNCLS